MKQPLRQTTASSRVLTGDVAQLLDELIGEAKLDHRYPLYRLIGEEVGLHPTTVMRYHQGTLRSANGTLHAHVVRLLEQVRNGDVSCLAPLKRESSRGRRDERPLSERVPASRIAEEIESIMGSLDKPKRQLLYQILAEKLGVHRTTIFRYHRGHLRTAPARLLRSFIRVKAELKNGEPLQLRRGDHTLVLKKHIDEVVDKLLKDKVYPDRASLFRQLDQRIGQRPGTTRRLCDYRKDPFIELRVFREVKAMLAQSEYHPKYRYLVGDRFVHHVFGPGRVVSKIPKAKILVEFKGGKRRILREELSEEPYWVREQDYAGNSGLRW